MPLFYSTSSCFSAKSKTIIVSYVTVSVYSSSCNYLFFRLMFASVLSISSSWCHQDIIRTQSIERKKKIKRERGQKPNNYLNCKLRSTKMVKFGTTALGSPLILKKHYTNCYVQVSWSWMLRCLLLLSDVVNVVARQPLSHLLPVLLPDVHALVHRLGCVVHLLHRNIIHYAM